MHNRTLFAVLFALLLTGLLLSLAGCGGGSSSEFTNTSFVSTPNEGAPGQAAKEAAPTPDATTTTTEAAGYGDEMPVLIGYKKQPGNADEDNVKRARGRVKARFNLVPVVAADLSPQALSELRKNPNVSYVEPDPTARATADSVQWDMTAVTATKVWPTNTGAGVKVAIIDTGIDYRHPDLAPNYAGGYNFIARNNNPLDDNGHGTHVAGTIAAAADGAGIKGVAPSARLYALKVLNSSGSGSYSNIIAALQWCVNNKMQIASMSLGATTNSKALHDACTAAYKAGVLLVAAAGNSGQPGGFTVTVEYPAAFGAVMAISAVDSSNVRPWWSSSGPKVELAAPGVNITSDKLGGGLTAMSGTSMACPHVSGVAALVYASGVSKPAFVRQRLVSTATDLGVAGRDPLYGYGLVNAQAACATSVASN
jgi:subtilisin family serine protease